MPVHAHDIADLVEMAFEGALKCPEARGTDPVRQIKVGGGDHDPIRALLDANDPIGRALTFLAALLLACDADDPRAVRPDKNCR